MSSRPDLWNCFDESGRLLTSSCVLRRQHVLGFLGFADEGYANNFILVEWGWIFASINLRFCQKALLKDFVFGC